VRRHRAAFRTSVALCAILAVGLRAPFLGTPLGVDEGGLAYVAEHWARHGRSLYGAQWLDRPPLLVLLVRLAVGAGGQTGVRVLGALAAVALVVLAAALARAIDGPRAGTAAAVVCAVLASSIALQAVYTPAELLAAVPASASVLCLVAALRSGRIGALVAAGALAACAALVKQSFLDAGLAGIVFLFACAVCRPPRFRLAWIASWGAGAALPLVTVVLASVLGFVDGDGLPYALIGFRIAALHTLGGGGVPLTERAARLAAPALLSGLAVALLLAPAGLRRIAADRVIAATLVAWLAGGLVGVGGGGVYWAHYLIEIVPVTSVLAGIALAPVPPRVWAVTTCIPVVLAAGAASASVDYVSDQRPHAVEREVGSYIRAHARPDDTQYVLYARANVLYYGGLSTPFPYDWSLMLRVQTGARPALYRLLASAGRPTWLVPWQNDDAWRLDRGATVDTLLRRDYRVAAIVGGHEILHRVGGATVSASCTARTTRRDSPSPRPRARARCAGPRPPRGAPVPRRSRTAAPSRAASARAR
jgi:hypothetical protein